MSEPSESKLSAHAWWDFEGACGKVLAPVAKRILGQTMSSSSCERNWSHYSFVHNKVRNKLNPKRAMDLVYVYSNNKVLMASKEKDEKEWYRENVEEEDSDEYMSEDDHNVNANEDEDEDDNEVHENVEYEENAMELGDYSNEEDDLDVEGLMRNYERNDEEREGQNGGGMEGETNEVNRKNGMADKETMGSLEMEKVKEKESIMHSLTLKCGSPRVNEVGEGLSEGLENVEYASKRGLPPRPRALFERTSNPFNVSKSKKVDEGSSRDVMQPSSDGDEPLGELYPHLQAKPKSLMNSLQSRVQLKSNKTKEDAMEEDKRLMDGGFKKAKKRMAMHPFAMSPIKKLNGGRNPLDSFQTMTEKEVKKLCAISFQKEGKKKSTVEVNMEQKGPTLTRASTQKKIFVCANDGDTSSEEFYRSKARDDSSGAEVKGDSDYKPDRRVGPK